GMEAAPLGEPGVHHHARRRAVGELAGVAGRDVAFLAAYRRELGQAFERRVGPIALVLRERDLLLAHLAGGPVLRQLRRRDRHDFLVEAASRLAPRRALLARQPALAPPPPRDARAPC